MSPEENNRYVTIRSEDGKERKLVLDEDGFIVDPKVWCPEFATAVAAEEGVDELTEEHWKIINYLRNYYVKFDTCPPIRMLVKMNNTTVKRVYELFPTGPAKGACRLAGAPKPTGCV